jgi:hypothetical protein
MTEEALIFFCDEAACKEDLMFYEIFAMDDRWAIIRAILKTAQNLAGDWQDISARPDIDHQPGRQFILIEGSTIHSGASWYRQHAGEAYIRKPGSEDEMLQYRKSDVLRICKDGEIDPHTARVTHWMPGKYPCFPDRTPALTQASRGTEA